MTDSDCLFGIAACGHQVIALSAHPDTAPHLAPHPWDILLLLNFIASNAAYRTDLAGQQAWVPFCLPKSAPHCFHFVYIHFPERSSALCIALVARSQGKFFDVHATREPLMAVLQSTGLQAVRSTGYGMICDGMTCLMYHILHCESPPPSERSCPGMCGHKTRRPCNRGTTPGCDLGRKCVRVKAPQQARRCRR